MLRCHRCLQLQLRSAGTQLRLKMINGRDVADAVTPISEHLSLQPVLVDMNQLRKHQFGLQCPEHVQNPGRSRDVVANRTRSVWRHLSKRIETLRPSLTDGDSGRTCSFSMIWFPLLISAALAVTRSSARAAAAWLSFQDRSTAARWPCSLSSCWLTLVRSSSLSRDCRRGFTNPKSGISQSWL